MGEASDVTDRLGLDQDWEVVAASTVGLLLSLGTLTTYTIGVFIAPLAAEFGWTRTQLVLGITVSQFALAFCAPFWGGLVDRLGPRPTLCVSVVCLSAAIAAFSMLSAHLWLYYLLYIVVALAGAAASPIGYCAVVARRFERRLGLALGICLMGVGLGAAVLPITTNALTAAFGWRQAYAALGAATLLITLPAALYATRGLGAAGSRSLQATSPSIRPALRSRTFRLLCCTFFILGAVSIGALVTLVSVMISRGLSPAVAAQIASTTGVTVIVGRAAIGWCLDRLPPTHVVAVVAALAAFAMLLLGFGHGLGLAYLTAILLGSVVGAEVDFTAFFIRRYFDHALFGRLYGVAFAIFIFGNGTGPLLASASFDQFGSYQPGALIFAAAAILVIPLILALPAPLPTLVELST